ncbi:MAG: DUF1816 domain-containing protein [Lyngbya sp.]|nr:DUF1816 domain-containing protein [Lyngbya sp.]
MNTPENFKIKARQIKNKPSKLPGFLPNSKRKTESGEKTDQILKNFCLTELELDLDVITETEEFFTSYLEKMGLACWIEVITQSPKCIYYFGPFASGSDAQRSVEGYLEDLRAEKAKIMGLEIRRGIPRNLTILEEEMENYFLNSEFSSFVPAWFGI